MKPPSECAVEACWRVAKYADRLCPTHHRRMVAGDPETVHHINGDRRDNRIENSRNVNPTPL